jgi:hypothetical protein
MATEVRDVLRQGARYWWIPLRLGDGYDLCWGHSQGVRESCEDGVQTKEAVVWPRVM